MRYLYALIFIATFILNTKELSSQSYFNKTLANGSKQPPGSKDILFFNDKLLASYSYVSEDIDFDREKAAIIVLDTIGFDKINETAYDSIDIGPDGIVKIKDKLYILGNSNKPVGQKFIKIAELENDYSIKWIKSYEGKYFPAFPQKILENKNSIYLLSSENLKIVLYKFTKEGILIFQKDYKVNDLNRNSPDELIYTMDNKLIISSSISFNGKFGVYSHLLKIDTSGNVIWNYISKEESDNGGSPFYAAELSNGNIVQVTEVYRFDPTDTYYQNPPLLRWINKDGNFIKDTLILTSPRLTEAVVSGMLKGKGDYFFLRGNKIGDNEGWAWIMKISNDGKIIWNHLYRHPAYIKSGFLHYTSDLLEEENGDLLCYGSIYHQGKGKDELWLFRVNKNGCYDVDLCSEEEVLYTAASDPELVSEKMKIHPNPSYEEIMVSFYESKSGICNIFNIEGRMVYGVRFDEQKNFNVDVSGFCRGSYIVKIVDKKTGHIAIEKFLKI